MSEVPGLFDGRALRVAVIGAGFIGTVHARAARRAGATLVGVVASSRATTDDAARRLGAERRFQSAEELVAATDVDVIHICTPNALHVPLAQAALAAGKHVVCEKPLAVDLHDAEALRAGAERAGLVATVPFVYRFYPMVREARARAAAAIGPVRLVHGSYLQDWLSSDRDHNWRVDQDASGPSRAFADIGSHWCDLLEFVTGDRLVEVCAELVTAVPERVVPAGPTQSFSAITSDGGQRRKVDTEDVALVLFRTDRGVHGSVVVSQISAGRKNQLRFEIVGAEATLAFDQERPDTLWVGRRAVSELVARDAAVLDPAAAAYVSVPVGHPQGYQDCFDAFVADTYRAVTSGSAAAIDGLPTFADGARAAGITAAVLRSTASRRWEPVIPADQPEERSA